MSERGAIPRAAFLTALALVATTAASPGPGASNPAPLRTGGATPVPETPFTTAVIASPVARCPVRTPEEVRLQPTQNAPGGRGRMVLTSPASPYGITVDPEGRHEYVVGVHVERLRRRAGRHYVVWAATPELDRVRRIGVLGEDARVEGPITWNKFLVFVSEEAAPDGETWSGPILLTGLSPSGRMHTMAGHGPFEDVNCADYYQ